MIMINLPLKSKLLKSMKNNKISFHGTDNEKLFLKNLKIFPSDWEYKKKKISYSYNEEGFRMKPFNRIDENNYILFVGCSHTVGVGLALEDTYSYKVSKEIEIDYLNLGMGGASNDEITYLLKQCLLLNKPPKAIIINWSGIYRRSYFTNGEFERPRNGSLEVKKIYEEFILNEKNQINHFIKLKNEVEHICKNFNINLIQVTFFEQIKEFKNIKYFTIKDFARDNQHPGIISNEKLYNHIIKNLRSF